MPAEIMENELRLSTERKIWKVRCGGVGQGEVLASLPGITTPVVSFPVFGGDVSSSCKVDRALKAQPQLLQIGALSLVSLSMRAFPYLNLQ